MGPMIVASNDGKPKTFWGKGGARRIIFYGGVAGAIEMMVNMPFEYIKTYMQLYPERGRTMMAVISHTLKTNGFFGLYRGLMPMLAFSIPKSAVRFGVVENVRAKLKEADGTVTLLNTALAGLMGGIAEAVFVVTPQETLKVRLIHDRLRDVPVYRNSLHGVATIIREQGL